MKMIVAVALALVAVVAAAPVEKEVIPIVRSSFDQAPEGGYNFVYETGNGIIRSENGELKQVTDEENKPRLVVVVRGSYEYPGEDGRPVVVSYSADENGYRAEGDSIPKPARR